ncbi:unnamed protein product (macronuclear) [Paramecium tetraurelia]|uniref:Acid phosphatase n=1 Tax=Paramecium tetraurelia TaxID=5888 RepID=A0BE76_PARTE|nr:uncharacterized protein GSPATT00027875001 [Paramecium tetraurelia]CAK56843.1 unnamed protein product [Paramecium tetraurelia]|eukprot:XP_001424241.1 hypothetical protein (macronuclear) [Paramecium tetraurelia strain d4-2]
MKQVLILVFNLYHVLCQDELLAVQAIWRHGARNPYFCNYECDLNVAKGDSALLTPTGMRQQYILGKWLRKRYIQVTPLLSSTFNENEIYIESSDVNRTLQSAYCNLQGMYPEGPNVPHFVDENAQLLLPPNKGAVTPAGIGDYALPNNIQLIPIHTKQKETDYALALSCPKGSEMVVQNLKTDLYKEVNDYSSKLYKDFNEQVNLTGDQQVNDFITLSDFRDTFVCNRYNGDKMPENLKAETLQQIDDIANLAFSLERFQTQEQVNLYSTPYFKQVFDRFDSILNGTSNFKYYGSSSHDSTILAALSALNLTSAQCQADIYLKKNVTHPYCITKYIDFAFNLIFELYNNSITGPYVKVLYNGEYMPLCSIQGNTCLYSNLRSKLMATQVDYKKECGIAKDDEILIEEETPGWALVFFIVVLLLLIAGVGIVILIKKKIANLK